MALTPDQQKRCDEIVEQALALDASARDAFVAGACRDDEEIFREAAAVLTVDPRLTAIFQISPDSSLPSPHFGRYQTEAPIGKGGMSMVYRARDPVINRSVAVKVMARYAEASPDEYRRFLSELHLLGSLHHPNIVQVFDAGEHDGSPFIVMEYLEGETLADAITHQRCGDFGLKLGIVRQLAAALQRVHAAAVCHRDVKPANVFLEPDGRVKLMDFGISARLDGVRVTQTGALIGTLPYLAPEQIRGEKLGPSVDIYAFGVLLFELFTGSRPFSGTAAEILYKIVHEPLPTDALSKLPPRLIDLIRRSTAKEPSNRPRDIGEILQSLNQLPNANSVQAGFGSRWRVALGAAACVALVAAGGLWIAGGRSRSKDTLPLVASIGQGQSTQPPAPILPEPEIHTPPKQEKVSEVPPSKAVDKQAVPPTPSQSEAHPAAVNRTSGAGGSLSPTAHDSSGQQVLPPEPVISPVPKPQPSSTEAFRSPDLIAPKPSDSKLADALKPESKAPSSEFVEDRHAAEIRKIHDVLRLYADANRTGNIVEIQALRTLSTSQVNSLTQSFSRALPAEFKLEPQSDPEVLGDKATVLCILTTVQRNKRAALQKESDKPVVTPVTVHLARIAGVWKIQSMQ